MCRVNYAWIGKAKINESSDTVLHAAVENGEKEEADEKIIIEGNGREIEIKESALAVQNVRGDTPLHLAASRAFSYLCHRIFEENKERAYLLRLGNYEGETPLFLAALNGHKDTFLYILRCYDYTMADLYRYDRDTILQCAIRREYFDLAVIIIHYCGAYLVGLPNEKGQTPLKLLATRPLAFRSGSNLSWRNKLLYHCDY